MKKLVIVLIVLCVLLSAVPSAIAEDYTGTTVRLTRQIGMHYAPIYVMEKLGILEKHLPGATFEWSVLSGGSSINEALISGQIDVGFMGIPLLLVAWEKGVDYRIACGVSLLPGQLVVADESIKSLADIKEGQKIAVPSIGSLHHIWIAMAAEQQLGDPHALDNNVIPMSYPDAYAAMLSGGTDVVGHYSSMPYLALELQNGLTGLDKSGEVMPEGSGIVCVTTKKLYENTAVHEAIIAAIKESIDLVNGQSDEVIAIIAEVENLSIEDTKAYLNWEGVGYTSEPAGLIPLADFMLKTNYIKTPLTSPEDVIWPTP